MVNIDDWAGAGAPERGGTNKRGYPCSGSSGSCLMRPYLPHPDCNMISAKATCTNPTDERRIRDDIQGHEAWLCKSLGDGTPVLELQYKITLNPK